MKTIKRVILGIVILIILAVVLVWVFINPIAKSAVEGGASQALGVQTSLASIKISPLSGRVLMNELIISNPEGFVSTSLMDAGKFDIQVAPSSLLSDTVVIRKFEIDGLKINIEQKLPFSNVTKILENIKQSSGDKGGKTEKPKSDGKKVKADLIVIKNVDAYFHLLPGTGKAGVVKVTVPRLELKNVSSEDKGSVAGQLVSQLFPAILASVIKQGQGLIPADFLNDLDSQVADLTKSLGKGATKLIEGLDTTIKDTGLDKTGKEAGKAIDTAAEETKKTLGGLFGSKDKKE
ncbi:MAG: hypothetical protein GWP14_03395 [Actinobacteria bacterium]|nr:hypothetical protein [Actinomycetota bacterium]